MIEQRNDGQSNFQGDPLSFNNKLFRGNGTNKLEDTLSVRPSDTPSFYCFFL